MIMVMEDPSNCWPLRLPTTARHNAPSNNWPPRPHFTVGHQCLLRLLVNETPH